MSHASESSSFFPSLRARQRAASILPTPASTERARQRRKRGLAGYLAIALLLQFLTGMIGFSGAAWATHGGDLSECREFEFVYKDGHVDAGHSCSGSNDVPRGDPGLHLTSGPDLHALELHLSCSDDFDADGNAEKSDLDGHQVARWFIIKEDGKRCGEIIEPPEGIIHVCKILVDASGRIITGSGLPDPATFLIPGVPAPENHTAAGILNNSTFTTPLTHNRDLIGNDGLDDGECETHRNLDVRVPTDTSDFDQKDDKNDHKVDFRTDRELDPVAEFTYECSGLTCTFDGSLSLDQDGTIVDYAWDFHDGTTTSGASDTVMHTFAPDDDYDVKLKVTDDDGRDKEVKHKLDFRDDGNNKKPNAIFTFSCIGLTCTFDGRDSVDIDGEIVSWQWKFGDGTEGSGPMITHEFAEGEKYYNVELKVLDGPSSSGEGSGLYYYGQEEISPDASLFKEPKYNDMNSGSVADASQLIPYDDALFTPDPSDDETREKEADGQILLTVDDPEQTLIVLNMLKPLPDLEIMKTPDGGFVDAGANFTWSLKVRNIGDGAAENVTVTDTIPANLTILEPLPAGCSRAGQDITCDLGTLAAGAMTTLDIDVQAPGNDDCGGQITNTGVVTATNEPSDRLANNQDDGDVSCIP
ncbi:MAG: PKD domain-containing protein, partial [Candidatus Thermoplasmatota archaeon]|nr:PKD domain-containing protein [Candidatus Thermoplasmatota archaeon]